jgi:hypothetical protein
LEVFVGILIERQYSVISRYGRPALYSPSRIHHKIETLGR